MQRERDGKKEKGKGRIIGGRSAGKEKGEEQEIRREEDGRGCRRGTGHQKRRKMRGGQNGGDGETK